jgi:hypothetical protein
MRREPATVSALNVNNNATTGEVAVVGLGLVLTAWLVKGAGGVTAGGPLVPGCWLVAVVVEGANT